MLDLDAIFDPDRLLPPWSAGPKSSTPVPRMVRPGDLPADWHFLWDERAAIMEYDGELPRERAEALALAEVVREMEQAGVSPHGDA